MNIYINTVALPKIVKAFHRLGYTYSEQFRTVIVPATGSLVTHTGGAIWLLANESIYMPPMSLLRIRSDFSCVEWTSGTYATLGEKRHIAVTGLVEMTLAYSDLPLSLIFFVVIPKKLAV